MSDQATLKATPSATSSPASGCGVTHCAELGGQMIDPFGPAPALVNLSAAQARAEGLLTSGTCGRHSTGLYHSAHLASSLVSRLQAVTALLGSTLYKLTWKLRDTPAGSSICLLRASVLRTSGNGSGLQRSGWVTPSTRDWKDTPGMSLTATNPDGSKRTRVDQLPRQAAYCTGRRLTVTGRMLTGLKTVPASGALLNPALSRWLQGLPTEWDDCAPMETPSMLKRQRTS